MSWFTLSGSVCYSCYRDFQIITATDDKVDSNVTEDTKYQYLATWLKVVTHFFHETDTFQVVLKMTTQEY